MEEQAAQLKADLLLLLGMEPGAQVEIGAVPAPDLAAVAAIDVEADRNKALGNNSPCSAPATQRRWEPRPRTAGKSR